MFDCPNCGAQTKRLIAGPKATKLACSLCYEVTKKGPNYQLHQPVDQWRGPKGEKHTISTGKMYEIAKRTISRDDNWTVINSDTGKEAQR